MRITLDAPINLENGPWRSNEQASKRCWKKNKYHLCQSIGPRVRFKLRNNCSLEAWKQLKSTSGLLYINLSSLSCLPFRLANGLDGLKIENKGRMSTLTFFNVSEKDYGNYTCVAINKLGNTNASIILYGRYTDQRNTYRSLMEGGTRAKLWTGENLAKRDR